MSKFNDLEIYKEKYIALESGHIYSRYSDKVLSEYTNKQGYKTVSLVNPISGERVNTFVHRYIAYCLVEGFKDGLQVNHIDGNRSNNIPSNLEWVTSKENILHSIEKLGRNYNGELNPRYGAKLEESTRRKISESLKGKRGKLSGASIPVKGIHIETGEEIYYENATLAGEFLGIDNSAIRKVIKGKQKTAGGYIWLDDLK